MSHSKQASIYNTVIITKKHPSIDILVISGASHGVVSNQLDYCWNRFVQTSVQCLPSPLAHWVLSLCGWISHE